MTQERSEAQIRASRENGALSRGPVTSEGKIRSSRNSLKHGLFAKAIVLRIERKENFSRLLKRLRTQLAPESLDEDIIIQDMAACTWRMQRAWAFETNLVNRNMPEEPNQEFMPLDLPEPGDEEFELRAYDYQMSRGVDSVIALSDRSTLRMLMQQDNRLSLRFYRGLRQIFQMRKIKADLKALAEADKKRKDEEKRKDQQLGEEASNVENKK